MRFIRRKKPVGCSVPEENNSTSIGIKDVLDRLGLPFAIVIMVIFFSLLRPNFFSLYNLMNIGRQAVTLGLLALGVTFVLVGSGVDLSVGSIMSLVSVVVALVLLSTDSILIAVLVGIILGAFVGLINGIIVSYFNVQPFAVTLGMSSVATGAALLLSDGNAVRNLPKGFSNIANSSTFGVPNQIYILIIIAFITYIILQRTTFGKRCYAVGGNKAAAKLSGVAVNRVRMMTFVISGICASIAAVIASSRVVSGNPTIGSDMQLKAIAAAVIGGASMSGGRGSVTGTMTGVVFVSVLYSGMNFLSVSTYVQDFLIGLIIVASAWMDASKRKKIG